MKVINQKSDVSICVKGATQDLLNPPAKVHPAKLRRKAAIESDRNFVAVRAARFAFAEKSRRRATFAVLKAKTITAIGVP